MIVFDLICDSGHRFEGWFSSAEDFSAQKGRGILGCPACGSQLIERVPSATRFNTGAEHPAPPPPPPARAEAERDKDPIALAQRMVSRLLDELLTKTEDVGTEFPAEARRIYYEQAPLRAIRGIASPEEYDALVDEGVPVARLPVPPSSRFS